MGRRPGYALFQRRNRRPRGTCKDTQHHYYQMQTQTTMRYHLTPVRMAIVQKTKKQKHW